MLNLLQESFGRLYRYKTFRVCLIIITAIPLFFNGLEKMLMETNGFPDVSTADDYLFNVYGMLPLIIAIAAGLFIIKDFKENTVRNKLICGYTRTQVYIVNWITAVFIAVFYHLFSTLVCTVSASILLEPGDLFTKVNAYYELISIPTLISYTSITVMMAMIFRTTASAIFSYFIHAVIIMFEPLIVHKVDNDSFTRFSSMFVPENQLYIISSRCYSDPTKSGGILDMFNDVKYAIPEGNAAYLIPLYALLLAAVVTVIGIIHFNKKDVK